MPNKAYTCCLELTIHNVRSPGANLLTRGDVYVGVTLFDQRRRTSFCDPLFPLCFHQRLVFEKTYRNASNALDVLKKLQREIIKVELIQCSDIPDRDYQLAQYKDDARSFFYPISCLHPKLIQHRELSMNRTSLFVGPVPVLEFTTYSAIREVFPMDEPDLESFSRRSERPKSVSWSKGSRSGMPRSSSVSRLSPTRASDAANSFSLSTANFTRQTVLSALRQHAKRGEHVRQMRTAHAVHRDPGLTPTHHLAAPDCALCKPVPGDDWCARLYNGKCVSAAKASGRLAHKPLVDVQEVQERPPFVVKHADAALIARAPGLQPTDRHLRSASRSSSSSRASRKLKDAYQPDYYGAQNGSSSRSSRAGSPSRQLESDEPQAETENGDLDAFGRPRRPSRTSERASVGSWGSSLRLAPSLTELYDTRGELDDISYRVHSALLRDHTYEKGMVRLASRFHDEQRHRDSLEQLELDLHRDYY